MHSSVLSAALQSRLAAGLYHCGYTYEDLLFIQVCSDPSPEHCITVFCKMQSRVLTAALQDRLAAGLCVCNYTYEGLLFIQVCSEPTSEPATLFSVKCIPQCSVLLCKAGLQQACITAITPMKICSSYRCALIQHQNTAALIWAKCSPHCSQLQCKTGPQQACVTATTPMKVYSSYRCAVSQHQNLQHCFLQNAFPSAQCCSAKQACSRLASLQLPL